MTGTRVQATRKIQGNSETTQRRMNARGEGQIIGTKDIGFHGLVTLIRWANGVISHHCADQYNGEYVAA